jgi:hypothetical protein
VPSCATRSAKGLDAVERGLPFEAKNDLAERRGEPPHVLVQWNVLGAHGGFGHGGG